MRVSFQPTYEELKHLLYSSFQTHLNSFQPTYEELKQVYVRMLPDTLCFQPTYEELKPVDSSLIYLNYFCFQPTYEELKQKLDTSTKSMQYVFSLPMRNWNAETLTYQIKICRFSAYLWGIETHQSRPGVARIRPFSAYLWGIETWAAFK